MPPLTPPQEPPPSRGVDKLADFDKLTGFDNWHIWHMKTRMALQTLGLRHLLASDGPEDADDLEAADQYAADRAAGVRLLVDGLSEGMLARAYDRGWRPEDATVQGTLYTLEALVGEEERRRRDEDDKATAARAYLVGLARMDLAAGAQTVKEYILAAKRCHDGLLARYGDGVGTVEEVLEQLFVAALLEGLRATEPAWYDEWTEKREQRTLEHESTRAGVTAWLLAKDTAATAAAVVARAKPGRRPPPGKRARLGHDYRHREQQRCRYCADHHAQSTPHDEGDCWFLHPHKAPSRWQNIYKDEVAAVRDGQRYEGGGGGKRKRSMSASSRYA